MIETVIDDLLRSQNPDGGWGATSGRRSNVEATSLTLLGLEAWSEDVPAGTLDDGLAWLTRRQRSDGAWSFTDQLDESSWATSLAVLAIDAFEPGHEGAIQGARWLLSQKGRSGGWIASLLYRFLPDALPVRLNPDLQGWSWVPNTSSWVEPTAYALITLKKLRPRLEDARLIDRLREGERLLYDRMCSDGGWNYGNAEVLGERLWPYPETTALALIALAGHSTSESNQRSLEALRTMVGEVRSGLVLGWTILCMMLYEDDVSALRTELREQYEQTEFRGETKSLALSLLALSDARSVFGTSQYD